MEDQLDDFRLTEDTSVTEKKRPAFLLVLCILTFVASGFGLIMGLVNLTGFNNVESQFRNAGPGADEVFGEIDLSGLQEIQDWSNLLSILACVLCITGAILMLKLKKIGFFAYIAGQVVAVYAAFVAVGMIEKMADVMPIAVAGDMMSMVGGITMIFTIIFAIAFIIMYGVNFKHLK